MYFFLPQIIELVAIWIQRDLRHIEHILAYEDNGCNALLFSDEEEFNVNRNRLGGLLLLKGKDSQSSATNCIRIS